MLVGEPQAVADLVQSGVKEVLAAVRLSQVHGAAALREEVPAEHVSAQARPVAVVHDKPDAKRCVLQKCRADTDMSLNDCSNCSI